MTTFNFEKLDVWQAARNLATDVYRMTASFPEKERFGIVNQMRRAVISISSNIAEGSARSTNKDKARFYQVAYGSLMELMCQTIISRDLGFLEQEDYAKLMEDAERVARMLSALRRSVL